MSLKSSSVATVKPVQLCTAALPTAVTLDTAKVIHSNASPQPDYTNALLLCTPASNISHQQAAENSLARVLCQAAHYAN